jgi:peptide/nickel transport system permease protein
VADFSRQFLPGLRRSPIRRPGSALTWTIAILLGLLVLAVLLSPALAGYRPTATSPVRLAAPSLHHLFGTDQLGRDVFSRTLYGGRTSIASAALAVVGATAAGLLLGLIAGYSPRAISATIMRAMDILLGFPALLLALLVLTVAGAGLLPEAFAISISFVPIFTRVVYTSSLSIREEGYVTAARVAGVGPWTIVGRHIAPAVRAEVLVIMTSAFGWAILLDSTLSFLGLGQQPPEPDWGADLSNGQSYLADGWWISVAPGAAITLAVLLVNLLGDQLSVRTRPGRAGSPGSRVGAGELVGAVPSQAAVAP